MKSNNAAHQVRRLISGGMLLLSVIIPLTDCHSQSGSRKQESTKSRSSSESILLERLPLPEVLNRVTQSDSLEALYTNLIGKSLTAHTVVSFENFMQKLGSDTTRLTKSIDSVSKIEGDKTLAEKGLSWQIGLYPMLGIDSATQKKRIKTYVIPTLAHYINNDDVDNICNYRDSSIKSTIYKNIEVPVYDLGKECP